MNFVFQRVKKKIFYSVTYIRSILLIAFQFILR